MNKLDGQVKGGQQNEVATNEGVNSFQYFSHKLFTGIIAIEDHGIGKKRKKK